MKAFQVFKQKNILFSTKLKSNIMIYMDLYKLDSFDEMHPEGFKYSWIAFNIENELNRVLFDCHPPKGPHVHINELELPYEWVSLEKAEEYFWICVENEFGPLEENAK